MAIAMGGLTDQEWLAPVWGHDMKARWFAGRCPCLGVARPSWQDGFSCGDFGAAYLLALLVTSAGGERF